MHTNIANTQHLTQTFEVKRDSAEIIEVRCKSENEKITLSMRNRAISFGIALS